MKKWIAMLLALVLALALVGCAGGNTSENEGGEDAAPVATDSLDLLNKIWETYADEEKFPVMGGDFNEENQNMEGPGAFGLEDAAVLDNTLAMPADCADQLENAASLMHMMNANTFTCGAYQVKADADLEALTAAIQENIANRQWICGAPQQYYIATIDNFVIAAFGHDELMDVFKGKVAEVYPDIQVAYEQAI